MTEKLANETLSQIFSIACHTSEAPNPLKLETIEFRVSATATTTTSTMSSAVANWSTNLRLICGCCSLLIVAPLLFDRNDIKWLLISARNSSAPTHPFESATTSCYTPQPLLYTIIMIAASSIALALVFSQTIAALPVPVPNFDIPAPVPVAVPVNGSNNVNGTWIVAGTLPASLPVPVPTGAPSPVAPQPPSPSNVTALRQAVIVPIVINPDGSPSLSLPLNSSSLPTPPFNSSSIPVGTPSAPNNTQPLPNATLPSPPQNITARSPLRVPSPDMLQQVNISLPDNGTLVSGANLTVISLQVPSVNLKASRKNMVAPRHIRRGRRGDISPRF